ncbi:MAG: CoxE, partial [Chloroflexi bacterium]
MDRVINDFVHLLRQHSVRVSPAESIEALQALHYVGLEEREVVRDALRAILVKSRNDVEVYDRLF